MGVGSTEPQGLDAMRGPQPGDPPPAPDQSSARERPQIHYHLLRPGGGRVEGWYQVFKSSVPHN